ncbi:MAG: arginine repressor [Lachnospiraceae bacterium]|jgi:transcriptional regulator of arginine metabolism|nr:arginine repressor [Lachnospiraceae bacterium]SFT33778.1 transcriptional regulator, ArgR family [Lachnospiraceae bacterium XBD2001]MBQ2467958.1 arginine repressor [Lachnospiraceae bacterium]MBQ2502741.1 arginine repressor [Lachnospiraceae bacterium]MBQ2578368.1 arginine repressor [Lachnospiraceae bacterium]
MKSERQSAILDLIMKKEIGTQEDLMAELRRAGYDVTQATVSRDIREMKLTKVALSDGKLRYVAYRKSEEDLTEKYHRIFRDGFLSMDNAQNILVIRTVSGMAMAVAAAIDYMDFHEIVGSIAGDDTIMCAVRSLDDTVTIMERLEKILAE